MIDFDDFKKVELKIGRIVSAEELEGSEKLLRLKVDLGEDTRQIIAGIKTTYAPGELIGREIAVVVNLKPKTILGLESQGMLLAASSAEGPVLLGPDRPVDPGAEVR